MGEGRKSAREGGGGQVNKSPRVNRILVRVKGIVRKLERERVVRNKERLVVCDKKTKAR